MSAFFSHWQPKDLIASCRRLINASLAIPASGLYMPLFSYLKTIDPENCWITLNEQDLPSLSEEGTLRLLLAKGYFKQR
jgi:hypothetical protein